MPSAPPRPRLRKGLQAAAAGCVLLAGLPPASGASPCLPCHPKEVAGYEKNAMASSLFRPGKQPSGSFTHALSGTKFSIRTEKGRVIQSLTRDGITAEFPVEYVIGSGNHAFGYIVRVGERLFQAPVSYYTRKRVWDVAPGYENDSQPEFTRPVAPECLECHAGRPLPVEGTLNAYRQPAFSAESISCDRCHGEVSEHLKRPSRDNIVNPRRLPPRARDSVCEQCHLGGEARVLNPKRRFADFRPGQELEEVFSVYVRDRSGPEGSIKVISHVEQLALSACARASGAKLWCGSCHNPHEKPERPAEYYRERCTSCHGQEVAARHTGSAEDCVSCHMPRRRAKDGGHTVFTDHQISRLPEPDGGDAAKAPPGKLVAWRDPPGLLALRNLGIANVEYGERERSGEHMELGARQLAAAMKQLPEDSLLLVKLGFALLRGGSAQTALELYEYAVKLDPSAANHHGLAQALREAGRREQAIQQLERALELDPGLGAAYQTLGQIYMEAGDIDGVRHTLQRYLRLMPASVTARAMLRDMGG